MIGETSWGDSESEIHKHVYVMISWLDSERNKPIVEMEAGELMSSKPSALALGPEWGHNIKYGEERGSHFAKWARECSELRQLSISKARVWQRTRQKDQVHRAHGARIVFRHEYT